MQQTVAHFQAAKHPAELPVHSQGPHLDSQLPCRQEAPSSSSSPRESATRTTEHKGPYLYNIQSTSHQLPLFDQNPSNPPPSTGSVTPVMKLAALLARNTTGAAISSGSATRPRG